MDENETVEFHRCKLDIWS